MLQTYREKKKRSLTRHLDFPQSDHMRPVLKSLNEERIGDAQHHIGPEDTQGSPGGDRQVSTGEARQTGVF